MRILILRLNTSNFGKIGTYNVQEVGLAKALINRGHSVEVIFLNKKTNKIVEDKEYNFVHYLPHLSFGIHGIFKVSSLGLFNPEMIIMWSDNQLWAKNVIKWSKKHNVPVVQYFGGVLSDNPKFLHQFYTKLILWRNRRSYSYSINVAKTKRVENELVKHRINSSGVISIGIDMTLMSEKKAIDYKERKKLGFEAEDKIILFVGRMDTEKKPFFACDVLKELVKEDSSFKMIMIGDGKLSDQIDLYIKENDLANNVFHIRRVPYTSIYKYMVSSNCFINMSEIEIFGMAILEAMYYGLPVVVHSAPGPNDFVIDSFNGHILDNYSVSDWCQRILATIKNRGDISKNAIETILNIYNWDVIANKFMDFGECKNFNNQR